MSWIFGTNLCGGCMQPMPQGGKPCECWKQFTQADLDAAVAVERGKCAALQAKIDALMLEYCPEEMTEEQRAEWARHQVMHSGRDQDKA